MGRVMISTVSLFAFYTVMFAHPCFGATRFGLIYDVKGRAELVNNAGKSTSLEKGKHVLMPVRVGDRIRTGDDGRVIVVALKGKSGYEIGANTEAKVDAASVVALTGAIKTSSGYSVPSGSAAGPMAAMVFRGASTPDRCITPVSPANTAVMTNTPEFSWGITCKDVSKVAVRIVEDGRPIYEYTTEGTNLKIPADLLKFGHDYAWSIDAGPVAGRSESEFSILSEAQITSVKEKMSVYHSGEKDLSKRLSFVFYLIDNDLKDLARKEIDVLKRELPDNYYLNDI